MCEENVHQSICFFRTRFYLCIVSLRANTIPCHPKGCGLKQNFYYRRLKQQPRLRQEDLPGAVRFPVFVFLSFLPLPRKGGIVLVVADFFVNKIVIRFCRVKDSYQFAQTPDTVKVYIIFIFTANPYLTVLVEDYNFDLRKGI